ncbi:hypothetical protein N7486_006278 [Penicillium sp. IBT 16267x]|nr:hypothetical protein N7486_006278 [Penicillium sp. IBT 16267x]
MPLDCSFSLGGQNTAKLGGQNTTALSKLCDTESLASFIEREILGPKAKRLSPVNSVSDANSP